MLFYMLIHWNFKSFNIAKGTDTYKKITVKGILSTNFNPLPKSTWDFHFSVWNAIINQIIRTKSSVHYLTQKADNGCIYASNLVINVIYTERRGGGVIHQNLSRLMDKVTKWEKVNSKNLFM